MRLVLSANSKTVDPYDQLGPFKEIKLGELKTGKGVKIGDNMAVVQMLLGPPTKLGRVEKWDMDVMRYIHEPWKHKTDMYNRYEAVYTFVEGRLVTIRFTQDVMNGPR